MALAEKKGLDLPEEMSPTQQARLARLEKLDGQKLEREAEQVALDSHVRSLRAYKIAAQQALDADVRAFAQSQIPMLEEHLNIVRRLAQNISGARTGMGGAYSD
jgi:putative membrane protein